MLEDSGDDTIREPKVGKTSGDRNNNEIIAKVDQDVKCSKQDESVNESQEPFVDL